VRLINYIEDLESKGKCWFLKNDALNVLNCTQRALDEAIKKLSLKKRIVTIKTGFIIIVPINYRSLGILPADWFIKPLMEYLQLPYYIGLLTAASMYGAAHQKPQIFQVMTKKKLRTITKGRLRICFYENKNIAVIPTRDLQVSTGYAKVAIPEIVAIDLITYHRSCGYMSNVATVLSELHELLDPDKLLQLAIDGKYELSNFQRLGYLLSLPDVEGGDKASKLKKLIQQSKPRFVSLQPGQSVKNTLKDHTWRIFLNEEIEVDQ
jgi:hypothetical protein